jgi:hypothetical protein
MLQTKRFWIEWKFRNYKELQSLLKFESKFYADPQLRKVINSQRQPRPVETNATVKVNVHVCGEAFVMWIPVRHGTLV